MAPHGQTVGYLRVSSADQNLARQLEALDRSIDCSRTRSAADLAPIGLASPSA